MNILKRELFANRKSFIIWSCCIIVFVVMMMSEFAAYYDNPEMAAVLDQMPEQIMAMFSLEATNLTTVSGYVTTASFYFYILLAIYSAIMGATIIAKEERDKTAEFLYVLPVSRKKVLSVKLIAAVLLSFFLNVVLLGTVYILALEYDKTIDFNHFMVLLFLGIFFVQLIFLALGMMIGAVAKRSKRAATYATSLLLLTYMISVFTGLSDKVENLKYVTPFKYFEANYILKEMTFEPVYLWISLAIILVSIGVTYLVYPKRDLKN